MVHQSAHEAVQAGLFPDTAMNMIGSHELIAKHNSLCVLKNSNLSTTVEQGKRCSHCSLSCSNKYTECSMQEQPSSLSRSAGLPAALTSLGLGRTCRVSNSALRWQHLATVRVCSRRQITPYTPASAAEVWRGRCVTSLGTKFGQSSAAGHA